MNLFLFSCNLKLFFRLHTQRQAKNFQEVHPEWVGKVTGSIEDVPDSKQEKFSAAGLQ